MSVRQRVVVGVIVLLLAALDWWTLDTGFLKPLILGAGSLRVDSNTPGAEVLLDGVSRGVVESGKPVYIETLLAGRYVLQVKDRFHLPYVSDINIGRGQELARIVELLPAFGRLKIATNPEGAVIELDGEQLAQVTPLAIDPIQAGRHTVVLKMFAREVVTKTLDVLPEQEAELVAELNRLDYAELTIRTKPKGAKVQFLEKVLLSEKGVVLEKPLEYTPRMRLPVGDYQIEVTANGYRRKTQFYRLRKGVNVFDATLERTLGRLSIEVEPRDAKVSVRIGKNGDASNYNSNRLVPTGRVEVAIQKPGYRSVLKTFLLDESGKALKVELERFNVSSGQKLRDPLKAGGFAPTVVVIPAGKADIGRSDGESLTSMKPEELIVRQPFAIGVTEVTLGQYRRYAKAEGVAVPKAKGMVADQYPVANVAWRQAVDYTRWLSRETGKIYRLPSEREWAYVAVSGDTMSGNAGSGEAGEICRFGNVADHSLHKVFPQWQWTGCDDGFVRSAPVGNYQANAFGVYDLSGNLAEWVSNCGFSGCSSHVACGSAWNSANEALRLTHRDSFSRAGDTRGFRVVREL